MNRGTAAASDFRVQVEGCEVADWVGEHLPCQHWKMISRDCRRDGEAQDLMDEVGDNGVDVASRGRDDCEVSVRGVTRATTSRVVGTRRLGPASAAAEP